MTPHGMAKKRGDGVLRVVGVLLLGCGLMQALGLVGLTFGDMEGVEGALGCPPPKRALQNKNRSPILLRGYVQGINGQRRKRPLPCKGRAVSSQCALLLGLDPVGQMD